jgi:hypothetical protein
MIPPRAAPPTPPPTPPPPGSRRPLPSWVWAVTAVVITSAAWGGTMVVTGDDSGGTPAEPTRPRANLAGYEFHDDMCESGDPTAFLGDYEISPYAELNPVAFEHERLDTSSCSVVLIPRDDTTYSSLSLSYEAAWHKASDPAGEFEASHLAYEGYDSESYSITVEPVSGLGDEAYIVYQEDTEQGWLTEVSLAVRDGWFEHTLVWRQNFDADRSHETFDIFAPLLNQHEVTETMRQSTIDTLEVLRGEEAQPTPDDPAETEEESDSGYDGDPPPAGSVE